MKSIEEIKDIIRLQKPQLFKKHKIKEIGIFGSYIRGEEKSNSDVDILVSFAEFPGLIEFITIEEELSQSLNVKVDLITKSGLKPELGKQIINETVYL